MHGERAARDEAQWLMLLLVDWLTPKESHPESAFAYNTRDK
jgi:hypothetical protein